MSIETLLEAARFLEWQAQQQQKTREENERHEKLCLEHEQEQKKASVPRVNHAVQPEEPPRHEILAAPLSPPAPAPPPPLPPPLPAPISVIPSHILPLRKSPHPGPQVLPAPPVPPLGVKMVPSEDAKPSEQKKRPGGVGTREVHNKLEKNRRAHLKECFETLKRNIPNVDDKKTSNLSVLRSALRYIQTLKRKEKEYEHEMERLAREKIATQQRLADLKNELSQWMDVLEIDRIIRQTVQPEDDQASTSTASEGEDNMDEEMEDDPPVHSLPKLAHRQPPELLKAVPPPIAAAAAAVQPHHHHHHHHHHPPPPVLPLGQKHASLHHSQPATLQPQALVPAQTHLVAASTVQSTVIAHTATTHASVIQTVNHVLHGTATAAATAAPQAKHIAHIAPSTSSPVQLTPAGQPIGHITVHPAALNHVAQLGQHLPLYPQPVAVSQPAVSHIAHTLSHQQVNGTAGLGQPAVMAKPPVGTQVVHHPQLVGQTVLNPVTMVTMPSFPVSTLKLA
nr:max-binding protein MNT [Pogona vitticeps]